MWMDSRSFELFMSTGFGTRLILGTKERELMDFIRLNTRKESQICVHDTFQS